MWLILTWVKYFVIMGVNEYVYLFKMYHLTHWVLHLIIFNYVLRMANVWQKWTLWIFVTNIAWVTTTVKAHQWNSWKIYPISYCRVIYKYYPVGGVNRACCVGPVTYYYPAMGPTLPPPLVYWGYPTPPVSPAHYYHPPHHPQTMVTITQLMYLTLIIQLMYLK